MALRGSNIGTFVGGSGGTSFTVTVPTNQVGDIVLLHANFASNRTATWQTGFTALTSTSFVNATRGGIQHWAWKRVSGSADTGSYSVTSSGTTQGQVAAWSWSGRLASGTPFSFTTQNQASAATVPPTLTGTAAAGDDLAYFLAEWLGTTGMTVTGFTLVQEDTSTGFHMWKAENTTAGSKSVVSSATASSNSFWPMLAAIKVGANIVSAAATLAGTSGLTSGATRILPATATLPGTSGLSADGEFPAALAISTAAHSALTAQVIVAEAAAATLAATSGFTAGIGAVQAAAITVAATSGLTADARLWADETNTGIQPGITLVRVPEDVTSGTGWAWDAVNGLVNITTAGTTFSGFDIGNGIVQVKADNCTVENCKIVCAGTGTNGVSIIHADNTTVQYCEISGTRPGGGHDDTGNGRLQFAVKDAFSDTTGTTVKACNIYDTANSINIITGTIEDNYVHDMGFIDADHIDCIIVESATDLDIRHNTLLNDNDQTSCIALFAQQGVPNNVTVDLNFVAGGGYCMYGANDPFDGTNIHLTNNRVSTQYFDNGGFFGPLAHFQPENTGNEWDGNVWVDGPDAGQEISDGILAATATLAGTSGLTATPEAAGIAATLDAISGFVSTADIDGPITTTLDSLSGLSALPEGTAGADAVMNGTSGLDAAAFLILQAAVTMAAGSTITAAGDPLVIHFATLAGQSGLTSTLAAAAITATLTGTSGLTATPAPAAIAATLDGHSGLTATPAPVAITATLASVADLRADGVAELAAATTLAGTSALHADLSTSGASVVLAALSALSADPTFIGQAAAQLDAASTFTAAVHGEDRPAAATLAAASALSLAATLAAAANARLDAESLLTIAALPTGAGAILHGTASLGAAATAVLTAAALLPATSRLTASPMAAAITPYIPGPPVHPTAAGITSPPTGTTSPRDEGVTPYVPTFG